MLFTYNGLLASLAPYSALVSTSNVIYLAGLYPLCADDLCRMVVRSSVLGWGGVGEGFGGLDADAKLIQVPFDHGDGELAVVMDEGRC
jgi:hypothetical protein